MGKLEPNFMFTGSIGNFTAYRNRRGEIILQQKGGPSQSKAQSDNYSVQKLMRQEFKGMAKMATSIRHAMNIIQNMADYRLHGPLSGHMSELKALDTVNPLGERTILLSANRSWMEGWQISENYMLEKIIRTPMQTVLSRTNADASLTIPAMIPGANFKPLEGVEFYRWVASLGLVHDYYFDGSKDYQTLEGYEAIPAATFVGPWQHANEKADGFTINLQLPARYLPLPAEATMLLTVAINGGRMRRGGVMTEVKYGSAGKILKAV